MAESTAPVASVAGGRAGRLAGLNTWLLARIDLVLRLGLLLIILLFGLFFAIRTIPSGHLIDISKASFLSHDNVQNIGRQMAVVGVIAVGETFVIITAGIDLSVGSLLGFSGMVAGQALLNGWPLALVIIAIMLMALAIGLFNGFLVSTAKIPPFIVTLGMLGILRGGANLVGNSQQLSLFNSNTGLALNGWVESSFLSVPNIFIVLLLVGLAAGLFLQFTRRGRYIYAVGSNQESARLSGINVRATLLTVYAISGVLAGVAGLLLIGRTNIADPNGGTSYELDAIAAAVLGGASLFGARGTIFGTFLGLVLVNMLNNGIDLIGLDPHLQQVVEGALLIVIVWVDQWRKRRLVAA